MVITLGWHEQHDHAIYSASALYADRTATPWSAPLNPVKQSGTPSPVGGTTQRCAVLLLTIVLGASAVAACASGSGGGGSSNPGASKNGTVHLHGEIRYDDQHTFGHIHPCDTYAWTVDIKSGSGTVLRVAKASTPMNAGAATAGGKYCDATYSASVPSAGVYTVAVEHGQGELGGDWDTIFTPVTVNASDLHSGSLPALTGTGY